MLDGDDEDGTVHVDLFDFEEVENVDVAVTAVVKWIPDDNNFRETADVSDHERHCPRRQTSQSRPRRLRRHSYY